VSSASGTGDPAGGLEDLRATVAAGNAELYRHIALYLQVLRSVLPGRVEQACFHLATQVHAQRYLRLPEVQRQDLHRHVRERVSRCTSLLTVEQLVALARRLEQEKQQEQQRRQQRLLQRLLQADGGDEMPPSGRPAHASDPVRTPALRSRSPLPPGSVRLELTAPFDLAALQWNLGHPATEPLTEDASDSGATPASEQFDWGDDHISQDSGDRGSETESDASSFPRTQASESDPSETSDNLGRQRAEAELMAALIEGLIEASAMDEGEADPDTDANGDVSRTAALSGGSGLQPPPGQEPMADLFRDGGSETESEGLLLEAGLMSAPNSGSGSPSPWDQPGLPRDPLLLLRWLDGLEAALARRLRNLSHAINLDLLRHGLSRGLLPVSLLEAVLQGQVETMASPANVLRLQLPFGLQPGAPPLQAIAILLRPVDLEMEEPRLRTCRRRIHQHRQQVRKMAQTYRRLQRRLQAHEAERLWLQDIRASRKPGT
jgi:hypothetical protein